MAMELNEEKLSCTLSWENCPSEILLMIFEMMPVSTLAVCMFVNRRWKELVEHVLEHKNKWEALVNSAIISGGAQFKLKSKLSLGWRHMYYNYILWNNINRADITLHRLQTIHIRRIKVYRDNLIVVTYKNVQYYNVKQLNLIRTVELSCRNFIENDDMIAIVLDNCNGYFKIEMFRKSHADDFNLERYNMYQVDKVVFYKVYANQCYVFNYRNNLFTYAIVNSNWTEKFTARFYGNSYEACAINVFDDQVYLMLKNGSVFQAKQGRSFLKMLQIKVPQTHRTQTYYCKMFYRYGFVFGVPDKESVNVKRYTLFLHNVFIYQLPSLTCMEQHGDILLLGYLDGTIEIVSPRDVTKTEPLHRFNIKDFYSDVMDTEVISVDAYEDDNFQHLFVATRSQIFHMHITYPNCQNYMWQKYTNLVGLVVEESAEGLAFKKRTE